MKNVFYRARKYLEYKKSKSIILVLMFFLISSILLISSSINDTISDYYNSIDNKNGISVSVEKNMRRDRSRSSQSSSNANNLTSSQIISKVNKLEYVSDVLKTKTIFITSSKIEALTSSDTSTDTNSSISPDGAMAQEKSVDISGLKLLGSSNLSLEQDFQNENVSLSSGELATNNYEIVISESLAELNDLKLNDQIKLSDSNGDNTKSFKVVGIYQVKSDTSGFERMMIADNTIYTTFDTISNFSSNSEEQGRFQQTSIKYYIKTIADFEQFKTDYYKITNTTSDDITITLNDDIYQNTIKPLSELSSSLEYLKWGIVSISITILGIVSFVDIKNREREIGILYSMSESKKRIFAQFVYENTILLTIGFILALGISFISMDYIINSLMNMSIFDSLNQGANMMQGGPPHFMDTTNVDVNSSISILSSLVIYMILVVVVSLIIGLVSYKALKRRIKDIISE